MWFFSVNYTLPDSSGRTMTAHGWWVSLNIFIFFWKTFSFLWERVLLPVLKILNPPTGLKKWKQKISHCRVERNAGNATHCTVVSWPWTAWTWVINVSWSYCVLKHLSTLYTQGQPKTAAPSQVAFQERNQANGWGARAPAGSSEEEESDGRKLGTGLEF